MTVYISLYKIQEMENSLSWKTVCLSCRQDILVYSCYSAKRPRRKLGGMEMEQ